MEHSPTLGQRSRLGLRAGGRPYRPSPIEGALLLAILVAAAYGGYTVYASATGLNQPPPPAPTYATASVTTLTTSVSASGSVVASQEVSLAFDIGGGATTGEGAGGSTFEVTEVLVQAGEAVVAGQPLARIDDTDLKAALSYGEADLTVARTKYDASFEGPSEADTASALQSISSAQSQLLTAQQNLDDVLASPTASQIAAAEQAVLAAENSLQAAIDARSKAQDTIVTDQKAVDAADDSLEAAEDGLANANPALNAANADLNAAESDISTEFSSLSYAQSNLASAINSCDPAPGSSPQSAPSLPSRGSQATTANPISFDFECDNASVLPATVSQWISTYNGAATSYNSSLGAITAQEQAVDTALDGVTAAQSAVTKAEDDLATAQQTLASDLNALNNGSLDRSIESARIGVTAAQQELADTLAGPSQTDISTAQLAVEAAESSLASSQARYNELFEAPTLDVTEPLRVALEQAETGVAGAQKDLDAATITAPFDGVITTVNVQAGDDVTSSDAILVLLNPDLIRIDANVDQADVSELAVGQSADVTFDALPDQTYEATVTSVGLTPTVTSGVVTYVVSLSVDTSALSAGVPVPSPGMTASVTITTSMIENAIVVPSEAVTASLGNQTVKIVTEEGEEERLVTTGITSGTQVQILSGLEAGEQVVIPATTTGTGQQDAGDATQPFGGGAGGGFGGGAGGGAGGFPVPGP